MSPKLRSLDFQKLELVRSLFWTQFGKLMGFEDLIISIDETTINTGTHQAYGWSLKGKPREIGTVLVQGKVSIISTILSNGAWVLKLSNTNTNCDYFMEFVNDLRKYLFNKEEYLHKNILLLIDNASYHKAGRAVACLQSVFKNVIFILPYSPQFNPIELFFRALKLKVGRWKGKSAIKLTSAEGREAVVRVIKEIRPQTIIRCFGQTIRIISENLMCN